MSASTSAAVTLITGTNAGAQVPYVSEWVQGSSTATYTLVGQILDNGNTNFVGYTEGEAYYLATTSASGAVATTLGDGQSYFYTSGAPPSGYLATEGGGASASQTSADVASTTESGESSMSETAASTTRSRTTNSMSSTSQTSASAETSQPGAGNRLSLFSVGVGATLFTTLVFSVMA